MQDLLELAIEDPDQADVRARRILSETDDPLVLSYAHQVLGIVLRDTGQTADAVRELRTGLRAAREAANPDRESDIRATLGGALVMAGRTRAGLAELDEALQGTSGELAATIRMRRAGVLAVLGRYADAAPDINSALTDIVAAGNRAWEGRARIWLAHVEYNLGRLDAAEVSATAAARAFEVAGATSERFDAVEALAEIATARGDLAHGLALYGRVRTARQTAEHPPRFPFVSIYATALLAAGLSDDAVVLIEDYESRVGIPEASRAELLLLHATALLAEGDHAKALAVADQSRTMFRRQQRSWYELRARLAALRAREAMGHRGLAREARSVADALHREQADEAPLALIVAGRLARSEERLNLWRKGASYKNRANGLVRASAHLASALERDELSDRAGVLRACAAGLDAIDENRRLMGSSELRALATTHGRGLTELALRHAAHEPRTLLRWSERTRATALAQPPATSDVATIPAPLAALRDNGRRLAEARQAGDPTDDLEKERLRLERAVRADHHTQSAAETDPQRPASVEEIVEGIGDGCLVELVDVDGTVHVLVVHNGRVRRTIAGSTAEVADLLGPAGMLLRRAARGRPANTTDIGRRLQEAILGDAARLLPDGPLTLAPTARLHGLAWSLLPALHDRPFGIVPSAGQWLRATKARRPDPLRTVLVAGPDLESGGAEVPILAARHPDAVLLEGSDATVAAVLAQLDGADIAHLATHGRFRADSPLFSALDLADGPLTVHDLERLQTAPFRVVLSACESGVLAPVGADEVLGLTAALMSMGTAGVVCAVAEVNDSVTVDLMVRLHEGLHRGDDLAVALHKVRHAAGDDGVAAATAAAFTVFGC